MQPTTRSVGGSRARVIYHAPGKSFAWLHKDGSFADFQKALRVRLNVPGNEPLVIKQIDGDYTLDIETEEEYEAFCHFAKSASQLHISVNGGLKDQSKADTVAANPTSTNIPVVFPPSPAPHPLAEPEDPTLGKRKASQITTGPEAVPSVTQKRKKRRKVGPDESVSAANNSTATAEPPGPESERAGVPVDATGDAPSTSVATDANQSVVSQKQKKKKRKHAGAGQSESTPANLVEQHVGASTEPASAPVPPPVEPSKAKKRKKTVVLDLSTVIPSPVATQEPPSTSTPRPPSPVTEPSTSTTKEIIKNLSAKKKAKNLVEPSVPTPTAPPVSRQNVADESVPTTKPKPPVSRSGLPRQEVYVEIITKKRKTGKMDGSSTVEKETEQQESAKKTVQPTVGKPKGNPKKSEAAKRIDLPNAPNIQEIMDGVIAAAMEDAKKRASSGGTTDVSENFTPPPQNKFESTIRKSRLADASSLEAASSATLLDTVPITAGSGSAIARKKVRTSKSHAEASPYLRNRGSSSLVPSVQDNLRDNSPALSSLSKKGGKPSVPLTAPPPNQRAMKKPSPVETLLGEASTSSEDEDSTPKKKPAAVSDPDDELDVFLHAPTHPSQKSVLEELPSGSDDEEEEVEREDMEIDEEDGASKSKGSGHGQLKVMARTASSSDDDSDSESVTADALVKANQAKVSTQVTHVSETQDIIPSSDFEDEGEPLPQPTKFNNTSTDVVLPASSTSDPPEPHMTAISNLKSAGRALNFFHEHVLEKPDPIENDSSHPRPSNDLPRDTDDPVEDADTTSTPKLGLIQRMKGRNKTTSPIIARKNGAGSKTTQSSLTSPTNSMLPPPTPFRRLKGDLTFDQPLDQSTPAVPNVSRKKRSASKTAFPETPAHSTWTTLQLREQSTHSMDDELISSPTESTANILKATPVKKPPSSGLAKQTPLFLPGTSQYHIPSSDLPPAEESSSEEEDEKEKGIVLPSPRVLRSSTRNNPMTVSYQSSPSEESEEEVAVPPSPRAVNLSVRKNKTTPYRSLSVLASQRSIFPSTPLEPVGPTPVNKSQAKAGSEVDDDDDEEDSGVSDSDSDSPPPSHIPKGRRAGAGSGSRGKRRSALATFL